MPRKILSLVLTFGLLFQQIGFAQVALELNMASYLSRLGSNVVQDKFRPIHLRYFSYDSLNDSFKLLVDKGDELSKGNEGKSTGTGIGKENQEEVLKDKTQTLLNYFLIGVTLPDSMFWVNLRPDSEDQIIDQYLEKTDVGKIMLETDLQLKKDTSLFTSPNTPEGREYWNKLYKKAEELYGYESVTIPTLTRPWIVPGEIIVRESQDSAYIYKATLKVMLEQDYLKNQEGKGIGTGTGIGIDYSFKDERSKALNEYSTQLIRELIIPKLTKEVNSSKRYASFRQVYYSLILSRWFKNRFKGLSPSKLSESTLKGTVPAFSALIDSKDLTNLISKDTWSKTDYFKQYQKSFSEGEYNVKEPVYTPTGQVIRSYFSGGIQMGNQAGSPINNPNSFTSSPISSKIINNSGILLAGSFKKGLNIVRDLLKSQKIDVVIPKEKFLEVYYRNNEDIKKTADEFGMTESMAQHHLRNYNSPSQPKSADSPENLAKGSEGAASPVIIDDRVGPDLVAQFMTKELERLGEYKESFIDFQPDISEINIITQYYIEPLMESFFITFGRYATRGEVKDFLKRIKKEDVFNQDGATGHQKIASRRTTEFINDKIGEIPSRVEAKIFLFPHKQVILTWLNHWNVVRSLEDFSNRHMIMAIKILSAILRNDKSQLSFNFPNLIIPIAQKEKEKADILNFVAKRSGIDNGVEDRYFTFEDIANLCRYNKHVAGLLQGYDMSVLMNTPTENRKIISDVLDNVFEDLSSAAASPITDLDVQTFFKADFFKNVDPSMFNPEAVKKALGYFIMYDTNEDAIRSRINRDFWTNVGPGNYIDLKNVFLAGKNIDLNRYGDGARFSATIEIKQDDKVGSPDVILSDEDILGKIKAGEFNSVEYIGRENPLNIQVEFAAQRLAQLMLLAKDRQKKVRLVFYSDHPNVPILKRFIQNAGYEIGANDQQTKDKNVFTILIDFKMPYEQINKFKDTIENSGLSYLNGLHLEEVLWQIFQAEFDLLKSEFDVAMMQLPDVTFDSGIINAIRIFMRARALYNSAASPIRINPEDVSTLNQGKDSQLSGYLTWKEALGLVGGYHRLLSAYILRRLDQTPRYDKNGSINYKYWYHAIEFKEVISYMGIENIASLLKRLLKRGEFEKAIEVLNDYYKGSRVSNDDRKKIYDLIGPEDYKKMLSDAVNSKHLEIQRYAAEDHFITYDLIKTIYDREVLIVSDKTLDYKNLPAIWGLFDNPNGLPKKIQENIVSGQNILFKKLLAGNEFALPDMLSILSKESDLEILKRVACNTSTSLNDLYILGRHPNSEVRYNVERRNRVVTNEVYVGLTKSWKKDNESRMRGEPSRVEMIINTQEWDKADTSISYLTNKYNIFGYISNTNGKPWLILEGGKDDLLDLIEAIKQQDEMRDITFEWGTYDGNFFVFEGAKARDMMKMSGSIAAAKKIASERAEQRKRGEDESLVDLTTVGLLAVLILGNSDSQQDLSIDPQKLEAAFDDLFAGGESRGGGVERSFDFEPSTDFNFDPGESLGGDLSSSPITLNLADAVEQAQSLLEDDVNEQVLKFIVATDENGKPLYPISPEDSVMVGHVRGDRAGYFARGLWNRLFKNLLGYIKFSPDFQGKSVLSDEVIAQVPNTFFEILSKKLYKVLKISENEKKDHVGNNANGKKTDGAYPGEKRINIEMQKSKKAYADTPQMKTKECADEVIKGLGDDTIDFILVNLLGSDMMKHTGNFKSAIQANEITDQQIGRIKEKIDYIKGHFLERIYARLLNARASRDLLTDQFDNLVKLLSQDYDLFLSQLQKDSLACYRDIKAQEAKVPIFVITADHGASEDGLTENPKESDTFHTANPVPYIIYDPLRNKKLTLKSGQTIRNNAATLLHLLGEDIPEGSDPSLLPDDYQGSKRRIMMAVLDGWGINPDQTYQWDAIRLANTPNYDWLAENASFTQLQAHGEVIGLRDILSYEEGRHHLRGKQAGQTDVGHFAMFAFKEYKQPLWYVDRLIKGGIRDGIFDETEPEVQVLVKELQRVKENNLRFHYVTIASEGGVHSSLYHMYALMRLAKKIGLRPDQFVIQFAADGRDVPTRSAHLYIQDVEKRIKEIGIGVIATVFGRDMFVRKDGEEKTTDRIIDVVEGIDLGAADVIQVAAAASPVNIKALKQHVDSAFELLGKFIKAGELTKEQIDEAIKPIRVVIEGGFIYSGHEAPIANLGRNLKLPNVDKRIIVKGIQSWAKLSNVDRDVARRYLKQLNSILEGVISATEQGGFDTRSVGSSALQADVKFTRWYGLRNVEEKIPQELKEAIFKESIPVIQESIRKSIYFESTRTIAFSFPTLVKIGDFFLLIQVPPNSKFAEGVKGDLYYQRGSYLAGVEIKFKLQSSDSKVASSAVEENQASKELIKKRITEIRGNIDGDLRRIKETKDSIFDNNKEIQSILASLQRDRSAAFSELSINAEKLKKQNQRSSSEIAGMYSGIYDMRRELAELEKELGTSATEQGGSLPDRQAGAENRGGSSPVDQLGDQLAGRGLNFLFMWSLAGSLGINSLAEDIASKKFPIETEIGKIKFTSLEIIQNFNFNVYEIYLHHKTGSIKIVVADNSLKEKVGVKITTYFINPDDLLDDMAAEKIMSVLDAIQSHPSDSKPTASSPAQEDKTSAGSIEERIAELEKAIAEGWMRINKIYEDTGININMISGKSDIPRAQISNTAEQKNVQAILRIRQHINNMADELRTLQMQKESSDILVAETVQGPALGSEYASAKEQRGSLPDRQAGAENRGGSSPVEVLAEFDVTAGKKDIEVPQSVISGEKQIVIYEQIPYAEPNEVKILVLGREGVVDSSSNNFLINELRGVIFGSYFPSRKERVLFISYDRKERKLSLQGVNSVTGRNFIIKSEPAASSAVQIDVQFTNWNNVGDTERILLPPELRKVILNEVVPVIQKAIQESGNYGLTRTPGFALTVLNNRHFYLSIQPTINLVDAKVVKGTLYEYGYDIADVKITFEPQDSNLESVSAAVDIPELVKPYFFTYDELRDSLEALQRLINEGIDDSGLNIPHKRLIFYRSSWQIHMEYDPFNFRKTSVTLMDPQRKDRLYIAYNGIDALAYGRAKIEQDLIKVLKREVELRDSPSRPSASSAVQADYILLDEALKVLQDPQLLSQPFPNPVIENLQSRRIFYPSEWKITMQYTPDAVITRIKLIDPRGLILMNITKDANFLKASNSHIVSLLLDMIQVKLAKSQNAPGSTLPASSPIDNGMGGIDLRTLPVTIQPMGSFKGLNFSLPNLSQEQLRGINIASEIEQIKNMVKAGNIPSGDRIKELIAACVQKGQINSQIDNLLLCLVDTLKLEEENASESSAELREALVIIDSIS